MTRKLAVPLAVALAALAGCGTTQTGKPVNSGHEAEAAFRQAFVGETHAHNTEAICHYEEGEWHCTADGHKGNGEQEECVADIGTVSKTGEISNGAGDTSGGAALPYCARNLHHLSENEGLP